MRHVFVLLLLSVMLQSTAAVAEPTRSQIEAEIASQLPRYATLDTVNYKVFPGNEAGTGRVSVDFSVSLGADLYDRERGHISRVLDRAGWSGREQSILRKRHGRQLNSVYVKVRQKSEKFSGSAEFTYLERVSGVRFNGRVSWRKPDGITEDEVRGIIFGSKRYKDVLSELKALRARHYEQQQGLETEFSEFLSKGVVGIFSEGWTSGPINGLVAFESQNIGKINIYRDPNDPRKGEVWADATVRWKQKQRWANSFFGKGDTTNVRFVIWFQSIGERNGPYVAMSMLVPRRGSGELYRTVSDELRWTGKVFKYTGSAWFKGWHILKK